MRTAGCVSVYLEGKGDKEDGWKNRGQEKGKPGSGAPDKVQDRWQGVEDMVQKTRMGEMADG